MKKTSFKTATLVALLGLSPALIAQSSTTSQPNQPSQQNPRQQSGQSSSQSTQSRSMQNQNQSEQASQQVQPLRSASQDPRGWHASDLKGREVVGSAGEKLGDFSDFIVDARSGKISHAVISSGGVLGVGAKLRAVPIEAIRQEGTADEQRFAINLDEARWKQAPVFAADQVATLEREQLARFYALGGQAASNVNQAQSAQRSQQQGQLVLTSKLIGRDIRSGEQTVGTVDDVIVQLQRRTAAALVDPNDEFAGTDQHYIVPLNKLTFAGEDRLTTTLTRQDFAGAKTLRDDSWSNESSGHVSALYVWPVYTTATGKFSEGGRQAGTEARQEADAMRREGRELGQQQKQQTAPVVAVREAIKADASQGTVNVTTSGEKLVLTGIVQSEDAKERIEERAEDAAQGWDVDNQIRVAQQMED